MALCAICDKTNQTTRICQRCRSDPDEKRYNVDWVASPWDVLPEESTHALTHATSDSDSEPGPFENATSLRIVHLHCVGISIEGIAETLNVTRQWTSKVITYWNENHGYTVSVLKHRLSEMDVEDLPLVVLTTNGT